MNWASIGASLIAAKAMKADCLFKLEAEGGLDFSPLGEDLMARTATLTELASNALMGVLHAIQEKISIDETFIDCASVASYETWRRGHAPTNPKARQYSEVPEGHQTIHRFIVDEAIEVARLRGHL